MKILKKVLCMMLIVPFAFIFVACKNSESENDSGGGSGGTTKKTDAEVLAFAFDDFDLHSKKQSLNNLPYSSVDEETNDYLYEEYDTYVYAGMKILDVFSKISDFELKKWCYSDKVVLDGKFGYAEKLSKFYVDKQEYTNYDAYMIYALFDINGMTGASYEKTFDLYYYEIKYYPAIESVWVNMIIERSRNNVGFDEDDSTATYMMFEYSNGQFLTNTFKRTSEIQNINDSNSLTPRIVEKYKSMMFNSSGNVVVNIVENLSIYNSSVQESIQSILKKLDGVHEYLKQSTNIEKKVQGITEEMLVLVNSRQIADIVEI